MILNILTHRSEEKTYVSIYSIPKEEALLAMHIVSLESKKENYVLTETKVLSLCSHEYDNNTNTYNIIPRKVE